MEKGNRNEFLNSFYKNEIWQPGNYRDHGLLDCGLNATAFGDSGEASFLSVMNVTFSVLTEFDLGHHQHRTMQAHELFRYFRMPELVDIRQYVRTLPTNTLMGFGAFAAITTFWYATRPRALKPPCDLSMQSVEVPVSHGPSLPPGFSLRCPHWLSPLKVIYQNHSHIPICVCEDTV